MLVSALFISSAIGGPKFVTGKKVVKTITKKTQGTVQQVQSEKILTTPSFDLNAPTALIASLPLSQGSYMVSTTATVSRNSAGLVVNCELRAGSKIDKTSLFINGAQSTLDMALATGGFVPKGGSAQLRCVDGAGADTGRLNNIEISALKVPKLTLTTAP
ncbi:MAG: hypothetical protein ACXWZK_04410 [Solirubrobacterales bacterium]